MTKGPSNKVTNPRETTADSATLGLVTDFEVLPPRPIRGPWRDPTRGKGKGKNPVLIINPRPEPVFDCAGRPRWTGKNDRRRIAEKEHLPSHGAPFLNLHGTVVEAMKLLIGAGEQEAARLLLCDVEQLTYVGREQRATASGATKDDEGKWHLAFDAWRVVDDEHVVMALPRGVVEIEDPSATQAAWRSLPERDKLIPALINAAEMSGGDVDVDFVWSLHEKAEEMSEKDHANARGVLIRLGLERWNDNGKLEINAPLLMQGPAGVRKLFEVTLDPNADRSFVPIDKEAPGTGCGRRNKLTTSVRQEQEIARLKSELDEYDADRDATLRYAVGFVRERDTLRSELTSLFDRMQQLINCGRALLANPEMSDAEVRCAMQQVFRTDDIERSEPKAKEVRA